MCDRQTCITQSNPPISCLLGCEEEGISNVNSVFLESVFLKAKAGHYYWCPLQDKAETMISKEGAV